MDAQLEVARQSLRTAQAYVNFLLNRPADMVIRRDSLNGVPDLSTGVDTVVTGREEMAKLRQAQAINGNAVALAQTYKWPKANAFLDAGLQSFNFNFNRRAPYYLGGVSIDLAVFTGGRNEHKVRQVQSDGLALSASIRYVEAQLRLQLTTARNGLQSALALYQANLTQVAASGQYYRDVLRLYREGQALYIELLDAQNGLINDQLQLSISRFDAWAKQAEVERANASFSLN
jgi:outer membrane protein TolC